SSAARSIADQLCLWCRRKTDRRPSLKRGVVKTLKELRLLKTKAILTGSISEDEAARRTQLEKDVRMACKKGKAARLSAWKQHVAEDVEKGDTRAVWQLLSAKRSRAAPRPQMIVDSAGVLQETENENESAWAAYWRELARDGNVFSRNREHWKTLVKESTHVSGELDEPIARKNWLEPCRGSRTGNLQQARGFPRSSSKRLREEARCSGFSWKPSMGSG
ncbi:MAG: uncharacterized protein A8A55_3462, partial [Amphiamblys sp. WSBS2006]